MLMILNLMMTQVTKMTNQKEMTQNFQTKRTRKTTAQNAMRMKVNRVLIGMRWNNKHSKKIKKLLSEGKMVVKNLLEGMLQEQGLGEGDEMID